MLEVPGEPASPTLETDEDVPQLVQLLERLAGIEIALAEFHRRAAHREAVIDRLHEENLDLWSGIRRALLDPVVTDLIRLHDGLTSEAGTVWC